MRKPGRMQVFPCGDNAAVISSCGAATHSLRWWFLITKSSIAGTLRSIIRQSGLSVDQFLTLLNQR